MRPQTRVILLIALCACSPRVDLPSLYPVPVAALVSHRYQRVNLKDMKGSVAVYDFIFTNCPGPCPLMTREMKRLSEDLANVEGLRFVSISVDPERDTPQVLAEYARKFGADERWLFLTGERKTIIDLSANGFKLAVGPVDPQSTQPIFHSTKFVLAGRDGTIRGYYDFTSKEEMQSLRRDARALARER